MSLQKGNRPKLTAEGTTPGQPSKPFRPKVVRKAVTVQYRSAKELIADIWAMRTELEGCRADIDALRKRVGDLEQTVRLLSVPD
jgi:hypothetical protein